MLTTGMLRLGRLFVVASRNKSSKISSEFPKPGGARQSTVSGCGGSAVNKKPETSTSCGGSTVEKKPETSTSCGGSTVEKKQETSTSCGGNAVVKKPETKCGATLPRVATGCGIPKCGMDSTPVKLPEQSTYCTIPKKPKSQKEIKQPCGCGPTKDAKNKK